MKNLDQRYISSKPHPKKLTGAMLNVVMPLPKLEITLTY
jgi:hypothetical protein